MISRKEKEQLVNELKEKFTKAESAILTDYRGLDVEKISELRKRLREANVEYKVVKNTLARIAAKESGLDFLEEHLVGPTAIAFSYDEILPHQIIRKLKGRTPFHLRILREDIYISEFGNTVWVQY